MSISLPDVIYYAIQVYIYIIIIRIILSLVRVNPYQTGWRFIYEITEPILGFFRRYIPPLGVFDFSPVAAILFLEIIQMLLSQYWR